MSQSAPDLKQTIGQRWHKWINVDTVACPPWGAIAITGSRIVGTEVIFEGARLPVDSVSDPLPPWYNGTPWNIGFTTEGIVEPGAKGLVSFDRPSWVMVVDSVLVGDFVTGMIRDRHEDWALQKIPATVNPNELNLEYFPGFRVLATRYFPDWLDIWSERQSGVLTGQYVIALVGGLWADRIITTTTTTTWGGSPPCGEEIILWDANLEEWISISDNCVAGCVGPAANGGSLTPGEYHWQATVVACV